MYFKYVQTKARRTCASFAFLNWRDGAFFSYVLANINQNVLFFGGFHQELLHVQDNIDLLLFAFQNHQGIAPLLHVFAMFEQLSYGAQCTSRNYTQMHELHIFLQVWKQTNGRLEIAKCSLFSFWRAMEPLKPWWFHGLRTLFCGRRPIF